MSAISAIRRRFAGDFEIDEWGLDQALVSLLAPVFELRWSVAVTGADAVPATGPALLVFNQRLGPSAPFVAGRAIRIATGRPLRVAGIPDVPIAGPVLRRIGGVLDHPDEIASLLRAGHLVGVGLGRSLDPRSRVGEIDPVTLGQARLVGAPVLPVALVGSEARRDWHARIGVPTSPAGTDDAVWAAAVRTSVGSLLASSSPEAPRVALVGR